MQGGSGLAQLVKRSLPTPGPRFESSHRRNFIHIFILNSIEKTKIKKKKPGMAHF